MILLCESTPYATGICPYAAWRTNVLTINTRAHICMHQNPKTLKHTIRLEYFSSRHRFYKIPLYLSSNHSAASATPAHQTATSLYGECIVATAAHNASIQRLMLQGAAFPGPPLGCGSCCQSTYIHHMRNVHVVVNVLKRMF